ncbi:MAG TPA: hypothetical protein VF069_26345 [Streptosporangiaceae bacterium]
MRAAISSGASTSAFANVAARQRISRLRGGCVEHSGLRDQIRRERDPTEQRPDLRVEQIAHIPEMAERPRGLSYLETTIDNRFFEK